MNAFGKVNQESGRKFRDAEVARARKGKEEMERKREGKKET